MTGCQRLTPRSTECKHLLKDAAWNFLRDRICLRNSLGGGGGAGPFLARSLCRLLWHFVFLYQTYEKPNAVQQKQNSAYAIADMVSILYDIDPNGVPSMLKMVCLQCGNIFNKDSRIRIFPGNKKRLHLDVWMFV